MSQPKTVNRIASVVSIALCLLAACGCAGTQMFTGDADGTVSGRRNIHTGAKQPVPKAASTSKQSLDDLAVFTQKFGQARSLESAGKLDKARRIYEKLIADFPDRASAYHRLGVIADRQRRFREAESLLAEALRRKGADAAIFGDLGYCFFLQGKFSKAESALLKAVSQAPSEQRHRINLGLVYGHQGRFDKALDSFRHAGSEADAQYNIAFILASKDDLKGAERCFRLALASDPTNKKALAALASFEQADADPDKRHRGSIVASDGRRMVPYVEGASRKPAKLSLFHSHHKANVGKVGGATKSGSVQPAAYLSGGQ